MKALMDLYDELIALYAFEAETSAALSQWVKFLEERVAASHETTLDHQVFFGRGDPNNPRAQYQYAVSFGNAIHSSDEGGRNIRLHRNGVIALTYALWEEEYRPEIAIECGLTSKDDVKSDVFHDLNKYRQAILHVSGRLDREPSVIHFFSEGEVVSLTKDHMHDLFSYLISDLNRIGETYYEVNPGLSLDKPLHDS